MLSTLLVNNPTDAHVANETSLREAIVQANTDASAGVSDTIAFDSSLGSSTINLTQGQLELSGAGAGTITIDGSSPSTPIALSAGSGSRVFVVDSGVNVVLTNLSMQGGQAGTNFGGDIFNAGTLTVSNAILSEGSASYGGAIENQGKLTLSDVTLTSNAATNSGGAIDSPGTLTVTDSTLTNNEAHDGGAISAEGMLTVNNSTFTGNSAENSGGAIASFSAPATITGSFFTGNNAPYGGALENNAGPVSLKSDDLSNNTASTAGGAIENDTGPLTLNSTTIAGNQVPGNGGGINNNAGTVTIDNSTFSGNQASGTGSGGAIENSGGTVSASNSTFFGNDASTSGGAIDNESGGKLSLTNATLSSNAANNGGGIENNGGTLSLQNTIVAGNFGDPMGPDVDGVITSDNGNNLLGTAANNTTTDPTPGPNDVFSDTTMLGTLGDYGGATQTLALLAGSPAIGAGMASATNPATDQRGLPRVVNGSLDIGAFQTQPPTLAFTTLSQTTDAGQPMTIALQLEDPDGNPVAAGNGGLTVTLSSSSAGAVFLDANSNPLSGLSVTIPTGASSVSFEYVDTQPGTPTLTMSASGFASAAQQETILPAPISVTPVPDIVVGRTLSSYTTAGIANNQETITFTVYNEQANPLTGVLLTDTLEPGVTLASASQLPDQSGQNLAWSLGTIDGFDRSSVTLTVSLASSSILHLDGGAQAFAGLNGGAVSDATPAATLIQGSVDPNLLASTPDANSTDPFIQEEAAALTYNPQNIFNFLHNDIGYNSYTGSLRGARGTLWSSAGNALDVASLGVALMRASGIPAQYVSGTLSQSNAQTLILSMFPAQYQTVGYIPAGTQVSDPANDPQLLSETESHYWFQFDTGSGMTDSDPLMPGAQVGQTFITATGTFTEVPDALRQKTEVTLTAEIYSQGAATLVFGSDGLSDTVVLDQTFNDVNLVGRPLSIGNFVSQTGIGAIFTFVTNTYSPYIEIGDDANPDPRYDQIIRGQDYQEVLTNFPLTSQVLTGLFLSVTLSGPQGPPQSYEHTILDRIGYAARQGLVATSVSTDPNDAPALGNFDITTVNVLPGVFDDAQLTNDINVVQTLNAQRQQLGDVISNASSADATVVNEQATSLARAFLIELERIEVETYAGLSDLFTQQLTGYSDTRAYFDAPRVDLASTQVIAGAAPGSVTLDWQMDLLKDDIRVLLPPGQGTDATFGFNTARGVTDNVAEGQALNTIGGTSAVTTLGIFNAANQQGIDMVTIGGGNLTSLAGLNISSDAKARISAAAQQGLVVFVPASTVLLDGQQTIGWYEYDPQSGQLVGVLENGDHGAEEVEADAVLTKITNDILFKDGAFLSGFLSGMLVITVVRLGIPIAGISIGTASPIPGGESTITKALLQAEDAVGILDNMVAAAQANLEEAVLNLPPLDNPGSLLVRAYAGFNLAIAYGLKAIAADPPIPFGVVGSAIFSGPPLTDRASVVTSQSSTVNSGAVGGSTGTTNSSISGKLTAAWNATGTGSFQANSLNADGATVTAANGTSLGAGAVVLAQANEIATAVSGEMTYSVRGQGSMTLFGPAESTLGVSAKWDNYSATLTGDFSVTLTTDGLTLNGQALPAGTYIITTSSATLSGSGMSTSPNFSGSVSISATDGTISVGPCSGPVTVGGNPLDLSNGGTLTGYSGSVSVVSGGNNLDSVTLNGNAASVLTLSPKPATFTTDQNTPVTFQAKLATSLADTYTITAQAPGGWTVAIDSSGNVTATPAPGLQGGTYPIQIIAQSQTDSNLVAQTTVDVTITPTKPGMNFTVASDPVFTVPFNGAQLPTAFRASIQNLGPAADSYNLTFSNVPSGFSIVDSGTSVTVPAGETGILGIYLVPKTGQPIPAPGTQLSFTVTATSESDASITQTQTETFTIPAVDALTITATPTVVSTPPGAGIADTITLTNVGNVPENNITLGAEGSSGLTVTGFTPVSLAVGQSVTETITLTPDLSTPLNSTLDATITASFGPSSSLTQSVDIPVQVIVPGAQSIAIAAVAAQQLGNAGLADRLNDLSIALTDLVQNPTSVVYLSQVQADLVPLISLLGADPFLASNTTALSTASTALDNATTAAEIDTAVVNLGTGLGTLAQDITDEVQHGFTLGLASSIEVVTPGAPSLFNITLQNTGSTATTYTFSVSGLPAGAIASFSQPSITLAPGAQVPSGSIVVTLGITETGDTLVPANIQLTATAVGAPEITLSTPGQLILRTEVLQVAVAASTPPFTNAGGQVDVTAKIQSVVNEPKQIAVSYTVTDATNAVLFTSTPVMVALDITSGLTTVDLGMVDTTGFANGYDTINLTAVDQSSQPLPTATGQGSLFIGSPVNATLTVNTPVLAPGNETVTNSLQLSSFINIPDPLTLDGQVQTTPTASTVALFQDSTHNLAYVAGSNGIDIVDVSTPTAPVDDGSFGSSLIVSGGFTVGRVDVIGGNNYLLVGTTATRNANQFSLLIFSLADPLSPQLVSNTLINYQFMSDMLVEGNTVLVPTAGGNFSFFFPGFLGSFGSVLSIDVSNPAAPTLANVLFNDMGSPDGGDTRQLGGAIVNDHIAYMASTTLTGSNVTNGVGRVLVVDYSNPNNLSVLGEVDIPGTVQAVDVGIQGNRALVVSTTAIDASDLLDNTGNLVLSVLDITDPANPTLLSTTVTDAQFPPPNSAGAKISVLSLGNGLFAVSEAEDNGNPVLLLVDPSDPTNPVITATPVPALVGEMAVSANRLYTASAQGLTIYDIGSVVAIPVTASVVVPTTGATLVSGSFNPPPDQIITGTNTDTYVWQTTLAFGFANPTFTWQSQLNGLQTGEVRPVTLGATVNFTSQGTSGTLQLPGTAVTGVSIISILPPSLTVIPGGTATYDIRLTNPANAAVTYDVFQPYDSYADVNINNGQSDITVAPGATVDVTLQVTASPFASPGDEPFTIEAGSITSPADDTASADLVVMGQAILPPNPIAYGVAATLTPTQAAAGQGTSADYTLQITNTGSADDTFFYQVSGLPSGIDVSSSQNSVDVPPGVSNFRDLPLTLIVQAGTTPGTYPFTVGVYSGHAQAILTGKVTVVPDGVSVYLSPSSGNPGSTFEMFVYNTGTVQDTFDLSLGGPAALVSTLATDKVTLAPGSYQYVPITTNSVGFADPGTLDLTATAASEGNLNVQASASAELNIAPTQGMTAQFQEPTQVIPLPGTSDFLLLVNNTGNIQDSYSATIVGTSGPVTASLTGLDGNPTQSIPLFILPGLSTGAILLQTDLTAVGQGTVAVEVQSLSNPNETATVTATVSTPATATPIQPVIQLTASPGSTTTYGQSVSFTATVGPPASGNPTPTGTVQFQIDGTNLGSPVTLGSNGAATSDAISILSAAGHTITALYSGDQTYAQGSQTLTQTVNPATPTVNVSAPNVTYNAAPYNALTSSVTGVNNAKLGAASSFTYYVGMGTGGTDLGSNAPRAAGTYTVVAHYAGSADYAAADSLPTSFAIMPQAIMVTANAQTKVYGTADPALAYQITSGSLVSGDSFSGSLTHVPGVNVGSYAIEQGTLTAGRNYDLTFVGANLLITPAPLTVTANNQTMVYGGAVPALTYTYAGLVNGESSASFTGALATAATSSNSAGSSYAITQGTLAATGNYTIGTFTSGTLTVDPDTTTTKLASSADPSLQGQSVTFMATVFNASSSVTPLGSVRFTIDGNSFGSPVPLIGNTASVTDSALGVGTHTVTTVYQPANGNFVTSTNTGGLTQTVGLNLGLLVLDPTGKDALTDTGNGGIVVQDPVNGTDLGAAIVVDSNNAQAALLTGNASVTAKTIDILGGAVTTGHGTFSSPVNHNFAPVPDPVGLSLPPAPSTTYSALKVTGNSVVTVQPGTYVGGISISGNASVTLEPGIYYMKGGGFSDTGGGSVTGIGVLIVNAPNSAGGTISLTGNGNVTLSAPTTLTGADAPYNGLALFQDPASTAAIKLTGSGNLTLAGTLYAPRATLNVTGNGGVIATDVNSAGKPIDAIIVSDVDVTGNGGITISAGVPATTAADVVAAAVGSIVNEGTAASPATVSQAAVLEAVAESLVLVGGIDSGPSPKKPTI